MIFYTDPTTLPLEGLLFVILYLFTLNQTIQQIAIAVCELR